MMLHHSTTFTILLDKANTASTYVTKDNVIKENNAHKIIMAYGSEASFILGDKKLSCCKLKLVVEFSIVVKKLHQNSVSTFFLGLAYVLDLAS